MGYLGRGLVRLETPVAYFYASHPTRVSFRVDFPNGRLTEWYPAAAARPARLTWPDIEVLPGAEVSLPTDGSDSHYYFARTTFAAPLRVETEAGAEVESFSSTAASASGSRPCTRGFREGTWS
jgi:hypothetical protein